MSVDELGVAATVHDQASDWTPDGSESGLDDYRRSLRDHLDRGLNPAVPGSGEHVVETHRSGASPDVTVDGAVGILVELVVSEGGQGRLRTRLDRFDGEYALVLTVAVEVRDEAAWEELESEYGTDYGIAGTAYGFVDTPEVEQGTSDSGSADGPSGRSVSDWLYEAMLILLALPVLYVGYLLRFGPPGENPFGTLGFAAIVVVLLLLLLGITVDGEPDLIVGLLSVLLTVVLVGFCGYVLLSWASESVQSVSVETAGTWGGALVIALVTVLGTSKPGTLER